MAASHDKSRRALMTALAGVSLGVTAAQAAGSRTLVAYLSRSGNTRVVAGLIARAVNGELFEIRPAVPYPDEYLATVKQATEERDRGVEPPLASTVSDLAVFDTVYLGFPIWGETAPSLIRSFLRTHDLTGKTVIPFVTHGGYGVGQSQAVIRSHAPKARLQPPFSMQADQERQTMNTVNEWLKESNQLPRRPK
jgi:flavodoxin